MSTLQRGMPARFPEQPPTCHLCQRPSTRLMTRRPNRKGHAGRPYHKSLPCGKFVGFAHDRGNDPNNPPCHCGASSKTQIAGREKKIPGGIHYVCRLGECDFYKPCIGKDGEQVTVEDDLITSTFCFSPYYVSSRWRLRAFVREFVAFKNNSEGHFAPCFSCCDNRRCFTSLRDAMVDAFFGCEVTALCPC